MVSRSTVPGGGVCSAARMMAMAQHHARRRHPPRELPVDATPAGTVHVSVGTPRHPSSSPAPRAPICHPRRTEQRAGWRTGHRRRRRARRAVPTADGTGVAGVHGELEVTTAVEVSAPERGDDGGEYGTVTVRGLLADDVGVLEAWKAYRTATFGAPRVRTCQRTDSWRSRTNAASQWRAAAKPRQETSATMRAVRWKPLPMSSNDMEVTAARSVDAEPKSDFSGTPKCAAARRARPRAGFAKDRRACAVGGKQRRESTRERRGARADAWRAHTQAGSDPTTASSIGVNRAQAPLTRGRLTNKFSRPLARRRLTRPLAHG